MNTFMRKQAILFVAFWFIRLTLWAGGIYGGTAGFGPATEVEPSCNTTTAWAANTDHAGGSLGVTGCDQYIQVTSSQTVCQVTTWLGNSNSVDTVLYAEFRTATGGGGSRIGTASATATAHQQTASESITFTWTSNPTITSDCYLHLVVESGPGCSWLYGSDTYGGATYCTYYSGAQGSIDCGFAIYTMQ